MRVGGRLIRDAKLVAVTQNLRVARLKTALVEADAVAAMPVLQNILGALADDPRVFARCPVGAQIDRVGLARMRFGLAEAGHRAIISPYQFC